MVDMGVLDITNNVCSKRRSCKRVPWKELGTCKFLKFSLLNHVLVIFTVFLCS